MAVFTVAVAANNEDITAKFYAAYNAAANNGDEIIIECGNFTPPFVINDPGLWTRSIAKGVYIRTQRAGVDWFGDRIPNVYGDGNTYRRRVAQRPVIWRGFVDHDMPAGRTKRIRGIEFQYDNATYWPNWAGAGETWVTKGAVLSGYPAFMVRITDSNAGSQTFEDCDAFGGYGSGRALWDPTAKYNDFFSPLKYFSKDTLSGPTDPDRGTFRRAGTAGWTTPGPADGWGDPGTLPNERPDGRMYNTMGASPGWIGGGISVGPVTVRHCYIHDIAHGVWSGSNDNYIVEMNEIDRIFGFGATRNSTASNPGKVCRFANNVLGDSIGHPADLANPHSDWTAQFGNGTYSIYGNVIAQNFILSRKNARATATFAREQPTTGAAFNECYSRGLIAAYNIGIGVGQGVDMVNALDAIVFQNVSLQPLWDAKPAGAVTSLSLLGSSTRGTKRSVGLIRGNFSESLLNDTLSLVDTNVITGAKDAAKQAAAFVDPVTEPTTLKEAFDRYKGQAGYTFVPAGWTLQYFLETLDLSGLPKHLAFVAGRSTAASQQVMSNLATITSGGNFVPGAGLQIAVYDNNEVTVLVPFQSGALDLTPYVGKLARVRATSSASAGVTTTFSYTFAGTAYTWRLSNPTLNRIPGVNISGYRARRQGFVDAVGAALGASKQLSFMFVGKRDVGGATQQALAMLMADTTGGSDPSLPHWLYKMNSSLVASSSSLDNYATSSYGWQINYAGNDFNFGQLYYLLLAIDLTKNAVDGRRMYASMDGVSWVDITVGFGDGWPAAPSASLTTERVLFNYYFNAFWDDGGYHAPFDGDVYMAGLWNKFIDWSQPSLRNLVNINNPDEIGPRFEMLDPDRQPALWAFVGSKALIDSSCNLNPSNPLAVIQAGVTTDLAVSGACLPGERLTILPLELQTPTPRVGSPVDVLVRFSGPNAQTVLTPTWGGVARSAQDGAKVAQPVSNGVIFSATPSAAGNLTLSITNDRSHTNPAQLIIPVAARDPRATINFTVSPASGQQGNPFATSLKVYDPA